MNSVRINHEGWLYGLAFLLALGFRFIQLGATPLTDSEATLALQALAIARGESPLLAPQPAYILFTGVLFTIIESTNFLARFIPALAGSALVFAPYFFRDRIKPLPALILAFLFAFDPGFVAFSRMASGTILAVTFLLFAAAMWVNQRLIPAGIFAAFALLSGPSLWAGILSLTLTWIFLQGAKPSSTGEQSSKDESESLIENRQSSIVNPILQFSNSPILIAFFSTFLLAGSLLFIAPNGLSAALASIPAYFTGWVTPTSVTPSRILVTFIAYEPLGIFLTLLAMVRAARTNGKRAKRYLLWLGVSLLLAVFYRQPGELLWANIPLLTLAAMELARLSEIQREDLVETGVVTLVILILLVYISFTLSNFALNPSNQIATNIPIFGEVQNAQVVVLVSSLAILFVCIVLVALGWSARIARFGVTISIGAYIGLYALGAAWGASGLRNPNGYELWMTDPKPAQADLLLASVRDVSEFSLGHDQSQPVTVVGIVSPALEWTLRNHAVGVVSVLDPQIAPPIVVTPLMNELGLPSAYRGQDFTWRIQPQWNILLPTDWIQWLVFRKLPDERETIILWARNDLFPDSRSSGGP